MKLTVWAKIYREKGTSMLREQMQSNLSGTYPGSQAAAPPTPGTGLSSNLLWTQRDIVHWLSHYWGSGPVPSLWYEHIPPSQQLREVNSITSPIPRIRKPRPRENKPLVQDYTTRKESLGRLVPVPVCLTTTYFTGLFDQEVSFHCIGDFTYKNIRAGWKAGGRISL